MESLWQLYKLNNLQFRSSESEQASSNGEPEIAAALYHEHKELEIYGFREWLLSSK